MDSETHPSIDGVDIWAGLANVVMLVANLFNCDARGIASGQQQSELAGFASMFYLMEIIIKSYFEASLRTLDRTLSLLESRF